MDGIIVVDKHAGCTSFDIIRSLRKLTGTRKMGHSGTLDPMATGVLAIFLGRATKLIKNFMDGNKGYEGEMTLGVQTDTLDATGRITETTTVPRPVLSAAIETLFAKFTGPLEQVPPMVSAVHHEGRRLYELARDGITVERRPRKITIHELRLISITDGANPKIKFYCLCSKGTYIRSLVSDMGDKLGCGAHLSGLRRVYSQPFSVEQAHSIAAIENLIERDKLNEIILDPGELCQAKI